MEETAQTNQPIPPSPSNTYTSKGPLFLVVLLVLLVLVGLGGYLFLGSKVVVLPTGIKDKSVKATVVAYTFAATLKEVQDTPEGKVLITDITGQKDIPQFLVDKNTQVFFDAKGSKLPGTPASLQANQKLYIIVSFDLKNNILKTQRIHILGAQIPDRTPKPSQATSSGTNR